MNELGTHMQRVQRRYVGTLQIDVEITVFYLAKMNCLLDEDLKSPHGCFCSNIKKFYSWSLFSSQDYIITFTSQAYTIRGMLKSQADLKSQRWKIESKCMSAFGTCSMIYEERDLS